MSVVPVSEVRSYLNLNVDTYDDKLQVMTDAAEAAVAVDVGPLTLQTVTSTLVGGRTGQLLLPVAPVSSVSAIVSGGGTVVDTTRTTLNKASGLIYFSDGLTTFTEAAYAVTYIAGWDVVPTDLLLAVKEKVRGMWNLSQRGGANRGGTDGLPDTPSDFLYRQLIEPYRQIKVGAA